MRSSILIGVLGVFLVCGPAYGGLRTKAAREAAEFVLERFGAEAAEETVETLSAKIVRYGSKYGDEAIEAIRKAGPRGFQLIDDAGENAPAVVRLLSRYGDDAVWVASQPRTLAVFLRHGDEAAEAMMKHPGVGGRMIEEFGSPGAGALRGVSGQSARRLAMMADDGTLAASGRAGDLLGVVGRFGDRGANFIWRNKGALVVSAAAAAFLADPEPFIDGTRDLAEVVVEPGVREISKGMAVNTDWTSVIVFMLVLSAGALTLKRWRLWGSRR